MTQTPVPPYGQPPFPAPVPSQKKSRKKLWITLGVGAVAIIAAVSAVGISASKSSGSDLSVGNCVFFSALSETASVSKHEVRDCSDVDATYEVATSTDGGATCDSAYLNYAIVDSNDTTKTQKTLCMLPNLKEGKCYTESDDGRFVTAACDAPKAVQIAKRVDGTADESICADYPTDSAVVYNKPPRTYCAATPA